MNHNAILPQEIYSLHLTTINEIKFSKREIDIIACILSGRSAKGIAHFLSIAPKTAEVHIYSVMKKLGCNSRDNVITLIQNSDKFLIVKQYYLSLLTYVAFEESLKEISQLIGDKHPTCFIVYDKEQNQSFLLQQLKSNLDLVGLKTIVEVRKANETQAGSKPFCFVFESEEEKNKNNLKKLDDVQCVTLTNYYSSVFEILQKFFPHIEIQEIVKKFETQGTFTQDSPQQNQTQKEHDLGVEKSSEFLKTPLLKYKQWGILISSVLILAALSIGLLTYKGLQEVKPIESVARSDLILPSENVLLNRPELLSKIEENLTEKPGIQTVALIGMGGVGKTTLARQFARQQNASVVWEINAETNQSLQSSFEDLAISLAKASEDKKILREIQETKDTKEKETKLLSFVKERLRPLSNWLLIYDNVEKFRDIQKYFPHDPNTWGNGKILITTRDNNIQNDSHVNYAIQIGELDSNQKLALFSKIIGNGNLENLTKPKKEEAQQFLEKIPPFPLDVSVAAYYLKTTNVPYEKYIGYINQNNQDFANTHEQILKEASEYSKTRYNIITISLQNLINTHEEFADLLLLISLIDSQNIPRDLLVKYKNDIIVDDFIYHLKKYSFITNEFSIPGIGSALSIHRSTQAMILEYLIKDMNLYKNATEVNRISKFLENQTNLAMEKENIYLINYLTKHLEFFLNHKKLLNNINNIIIEGNLGCLYYYSGNYKKSKNLIEKNILQLSKYPELSNLQLGKFSIYLGIVYRELGYYTQAEESLTKSLTIYKTNFPDNEKEIAFILSNLGNVYRNLGEYLKAENLLEKSLLIYKSHFSESYAYIARTVIYLANVYKSLGSYEKSKNLLEDSFITDKKGFSQYLPELAQALTVLGHTYRGLGYHEKARELLEQSLKIHKEIYEKNHINIAWVSVYLGNVYRLLNDYEKSRELLEQSLETYKRNYKRDHIDIAWASAHLGCTYRELGLHEKAKQLIKESLKTYENTYGADHLVVAWLLRNLGKIYMVEGDLETAKRYIIKALEILQQNNHPESYMCFELLSELLLKQSESNMNTKVAQKGFKRESVNYLKKALEIVKTHFAQDSPHIIRIQNKIKTLDKK